MSYVLISQDLAVIQAMAHRVAVMKEGIIVEQGDTDALFARPATDYTRTLIGVAGLQIGSRPS